MTSGGTLTVRSRRRGRSDRVATRKRTYRLKQSTASIGGRQTLRLKVKLPKRAFRAGTKTLRNRGKVKAKVVVNGADLAGNTATKQLGVSLKAKRKRR